MLMYSVSVPTHKIFVIVNKLKMELFGTKILADFLKTIENFKEL